MKNILRNKNIIIVIILIILIIVTIFLIKKSYSFQTIYDILPENSIIVGDKVFEGEINPNYIANEAINYYIKTNDENVKIYKYNGLDNNGYPIWGTYSDETNSYVEIPSEEIEVIEEILKNKYERELYNE